MLFARGLCAPIPKKEQQNMKLSETCFDNSHSAICWSDLRKAANCKSLRLKGHALQTTLR